MGKLLKARKLDKAKRKPSRQATTKPNKPVTAAPIAPEAPKQEFKAIRAYVAGETAPEAPKPLRKKAEKGKPKRQADGGFDVSANLKALEKGDRVVLTYTTEAGKATKMTPPKALRLKGIKINFATGEVKELTGRSPFIVDDVYEAQNGYQGIVVIKSHAGSFAIDRSSVSKLDD